MARVPQSRAELENHLKEQIAFIEASAVAYENGFEAEAKRLAVVLRVLLHDTGQSESLLNQLGLKDIDYIDTATEYIPGKTISGDRLTIMKVTVGAAGGAAFSPRCAAPPNPAFPPKDISFDDWWNDAVIIDKEGREFSRKKLVLGLSNKDGGAHIDPELNESYAELTRNNSMGWRYETQDDAAEIRAVELASVRQIAHEVIESLKKGCPDFFE